MIAAFAMADERPRIWLVSGAVALLAHLSVVAALVLRFEWTNMRTSAPQATAMTVEVAELPSAPPVPPRQVAPGPKRVESRPAPRRTLQLEKSQFDTPLKAATEAVVVQKHEKSEPDPNPIYAQQAPDTTAPAAIAAKPSNETKAPAEGTPSNRRGTAEQIWEGKVLARLERYKRYPGWAQRQHLEDTVFLDFTLDRKGNVLAYRIDRSAGYELLNGEVLSLIQRAAPFPSPPKEVTGDSIELLVPIEFFIKKP